MLLVGRDISSYNFCKISYLIWMQSYLISDQVLKIMIFSSKIPGSNRLDTFVIFLWRLVNTDCMQMFLQVQMFCSLFEAQATQLFLMLQ